MGIFDADPAYQQLRTIREDQGYTGWLDQDLNKVDEHGNLIELGPNRTFTHRDVLCTGVMRGWADAETDPTRIDWTVRRARAAIPFELRNGRPLNPHAPTGIPHGRGELGHWGEALAADALVTAIHVGHRWTLLIERTDGHGWAVAGGHVDPGEAPVDAAARELEEETGLHLPGADWHAGAPRYVPDPRATDEAWMVTVLASTDLGAVNELPTVAGDDDAARAEWVRADTYAQLVDELHTRFNGTVFAAHRQMLAEALDTPTP